MSLNIMFRAGSHRVPSPNYNMDAYMATLFESLELVLQVGSSKKVDMTLNLSCDYFFII
jgi:hypothetical protein